jgi:hypothetical protein
MSALASRRIRWGTWSRLISRSVATGAVAFFVALPAFAADVPVSENAKQHFQAGVAFLQDPDGARYEEAYREFQAAYADSPSWKILSNLGIAAMKLERDGEAINAFQKYLAEGGAEIDAEEKAQVERDLATLKASAATLTLSTNPAGAQITDERVPVTGSPIVNRYGPTQGPLTVVVRAGHHRLTARIAGQPDVVWETDVTSQGAVEHTFDFTTAPAAPPGATQPGPVADEGGGVPTGVYIGLAATGVFAAGGAVAGILAMGKNSDYEEANDGSDPAAAEDIKKSGETLNLVADICFGAAVVSAGVTAVIYFTSSGSSSKAGSGTKTVQSAGLKVTPVVGPRGAGIFAEQRF